MKMKRIALVGLVFSASAFAVMDGQAKISGIIGNIAEDSVELTTTSGVVAIPKKYFDAKTLRPGTEVQVTASLSDVVSLNDRLKTKNKGAKK